MWSSTELRRTPAPGGKPLALLVLAVILSLGVGPCGYERAGSNRSWPANIHSIAVPAFRNSSLRYRVEQRFTRAVMDEILRRGRRLEVTSRPEDADAVLLGDVRRVDIGGALLDPTGRTRVFQIAITLSVLLREQPTQKILFEKSDYTFRGEYELPDGPSSLFDEEGPAVDRLARDFAHSLITTLLEGG
ncbi:MAG: LptE family protein [Acidobacteria bacterium]|nr:LptE family protein [Acidobacteriota bacterium]